MKKIKIWGETIPYNSKRSKLEDMEIKPSKIALLRMVRFILGIRGKAYKDNRAVIDTFTYYQQILGGFETETYEDEPYIVPSLVKDSDRAVIVVPGGGFSYKQSDYDAEGNQSEGDLVAMELNKAGISAFVLWYRTNPYCFPVPLVDMQRAVRFVRYHAAEYGLNPDKISAIGFSGGGYEIAGLLNLLRGKNAFSEGYVPDTVDAVSDELQTAGLIYPCVSFKCLMPMMSACFTREQVDTEEKRQKLADQYSCVKNYSSADVPQFFSYGGKDFMIPPAHEEEYIEKLKATGTDHEILFIPTANHGFGASPKSRKKYGYWLERYIDWFKKHTD